MCAVHPSSVKLPGWVEGEEDGEPVLVHGTIDAAVLWPWDLLHWLHSSGKFEQWVSDDPSKAAQKVAQYWQHCRHLEFFNELGLEQTEFGHTVPIFWHTDGVRIYRAQKAWVYSYSSACRKGDTSLETKLVYTLIHESSIRKNATHDKVARHIGYIMDVLATGCFPSCDEEGRAFEEGSHLAMRAGSRIAGNWTFRFAGFKADWEARVVCHKFERNYAANLICDQCPASRGGVPTGMSVGLTKSTSICAPDTGCLDGYTSKGGDVSETWRT